LVRRVFAGRMPSRASHPGPIPAPDREFILFAEEAELPPLPALDLATLLLLAAGTLGSLIAILIIN
jgi:hypothetical protein